MVTRALRNRFSLDTAFEMVRTPKIRNDYGRPKALNFLEKEVTDFYMPLDEHIQFSTAVRSLALLR